MRRGLLAVLFLAAMVGFAPSAPAGASDAEVYAVASSYDEKVLYWTNVARRNHGLRALRMGSCLDGYAERWTRRMAARDVFAHQELGPIMRDCRLSAAGENIACHSGGLTPRQVVRMWMDSPGHRANILNRRYRRIGIAAWRSADTGRIYVTQDFGG